MSRCCAATAAVDVDSATGAEGVYGRLCKGLGRLVVCSHDVRQTRIGVHADAAWRYLVQPADVWQQLLGTEAAVQAYGEQRPVAHGGHEGIDGLSAQRASGGIAQRGADHHGDVLAALFAEVYDGLHGTFGVERIEDGLYEQHVTAAVYEASRLLTVGVIQLPERYVARTGVVHIAADGEGLVRGAHRACHQPWAVVRVGHLTPQCSTGACYLIYPVLQAVIA